MKKKCDICGRNEIMLPVYTIDKKKRGLNVPVKMFIDQLHGKFTIATKNVRNICRDCLYKITLPESTYQMKIAEDGKDGITFKTFE